MRERRGGYEVDGRRRIDLNDFSETVYEREEEVVVEGETVEIREDFNFVRDGRRRL